MITLTRTYKFHPDNAIPKGNWIWVFGSDEAGKHRHGPAKVAHVTFKAAYGVGSGPTGFAYALPIEDKHLSPLPFTVVSQGVDAFLQYAASHPKLDFYVVRGGTDGHGLDDRDIGALFAKAPTNCSLPEAWRHHVDAAFAGK